jgi:hypothetical protein
MVLGQSLIVAVKMETMAYGQDLAMWASPEACLSTLAIWQLQGGATVL